MLNLSRNGGGLLEEAVRLTGLFVGEGGIVAVKDNKGMVKILANGSAEPGKEYNKNNIIEPLPKKIQRRSTWARWLF